MVTLYALPSHPRGRFFIIALLATTLLAGCSYAPTPLDDRFGQSLQTAKDAQRLPPQPDSASPSQPMATELKGALDNHIKGKAAVGPALQAPVTGAATSFGP